MELNRRRAVLPWPNGRTLMTAILLAAAVSPREAVLRVGELVRGKRVRAWNGLCTTAARHPGHYRRWQRHALPFREREWCGTAEPIGNLAVLVMGRETAAIADTCAALDALGIVRLVVPLDTTAAAPATLAAVFARLDASGIAWLVACQAGDRLRRVLPAAMAAALAENSRADILYWDEDLETGDAISAPWIKGEWDPLLHLSRDMLGGASAMALGAVQRIAGRLGALPATPAGFAELAMAMLAEGARPVHIPLVLTHRGQSSERLPAVEWSAIVTRQWHSPVKLARRADALPFLVVTPCDPPAWPLVSIMIPTRDRADLLGACLASLARLEYAGGTEIVIVDNGSTDPAALALLARTAQAGTARVLRAPGPFNFSRLNNIAARAARGSLLCLLNNDVEALDGGWLSAMARHAVQPGVGAVGAQLLYADGTVQHAGVAIGLGGAAGHVQRGVDPGDPVHAAWHAVTRQVSAVTAACLLVRRDAWAAVGGLDEGGFAVAFNDVDFCLKLQATGLANIFCAEARLLHAESRSRPKDHRPDQAARFAGELALLQSRWDTARRHDPHFSPLFQRSAEKCLLSMA